MTSSPLSRRTVLTTGAVALGAAVAGCFEDADPAGADAPGSDPDGPLTVASATQYQGPACACCNEYTPYLETHLDGEVTVEVTDDLLEQKAALGVPRELRSCHTVVIDGSVFEGHLPVEPIADFLADDTDWLGIALPGMPAGSPGMGGEKSEPWTIFAFDEAGEFAEYVEL